MLLLLIWEQIIQRVLGGVTFLLLLRGQESQHCWFSEQAAAAQAESAANFSLLQPTKTFNFPCCLSHHLPPHPTKLIEPNSHSMAWHATPRSPRDPACLMPAPFSYRHCCAGKGQNPGQRYQTYAILLVQLPPPPKVATSQDKGIPKVRHPHHTSSAGS